MKRFILILFISAGFYGLSNAQTYNIALMAAEEQLHTDDVYNKLQATGIFNSIDTFNIRFITPTTTTMLNYDAILVWSNYQIFDATTFGNNLAAYIDAGGGVVTSVFAFDSDPTYSIGGNFETNYRVIIPNATLHSGSNMTVSYIDDLHPIINEYTLFNGGTQSFHSIGVSTSTGAVTLATWSDASPLAVYESNVGPSMVRRVDLNFWPVSNDGFGGGWVADGDKYMANSLAWVAGGLCSDETFTASTGTISDGSGTLNYSNNQDCYLLIQPPGATQVTLNFISFNTESCCDYLDVYDGPDDSSPFIGSFSGTAIPGTINSSGGSLYLWFSTDGSFTNPGWSANYTSTFLTSTFVQTELTGGSSKQWILAQTGLAIGVGPYPGSFDWWSYGEGGASSFQDRPCAADDIFTFNNSGFLDFNSNNTIFLDQEQFGGWNDALGADQCHDESEPGLFVAYDASNVSAFANGGSYTFSYDQLTGTLNISGLGHYIGYTGKTNTGDYSFPVSSKDYAISSIGGGVMQLVMVVNGGEAYWTFNLQEYSTPEPPASLISYATSSTEIVLEWQDVFFENGYYIRRSIDGSSYSQIDFVSADVTSYTDNNFGSGLSPNTLYYYQVSANNTFGESSPAETENATFSTSLTTNFNYNDIYSGANNDYAEGIAADDQGNYYVTGRYNNQIEFKSNFLNSTNTNNQNSVFLTKFDPDGNVFWTRSVDPDDQIAARDVIVSADGSVYITGYFWGNIIFAGSTITSTPGTFSAYVLKYDANGNEIWARTVSSSDYSVARTLGSDSQGNIYVGGRLPAAGASFAGNSVTEPGSMLLKYDPDGNEIWIAHAPVITSPGAWVTDILSMDIDANGIYVTGDLFGFTDFGNGVTITVGEEGDMFVAKYDFNGNALWVQSGGGTDYELGRDITLDNSGNVYATGQFRSSSFSAPGINLVNNGAGNTDIVVLKYDQNGTLLWGQNHGSFPNDIPYSITSDGVNVYATGYKSKRTVSFNGINVDNGGLWLAKYLPDGTVEWVEKVEGEIWGYELDYFNGRVYMAGNFEYYANFGTFQAQAQGFRDIHVATIDVGTVGSLIGYWPINFETGGSDITGNGNNLEDESTGVGASGTDRFKIGAESLEFSGSNYVVARSSTHPMGDPSFSYSFWEYHTTEGDIRATAFDVGAGSFEIRIDHFSGNIEVFGNGAQVFSDNTISDARANRWNHIVVAKDGSDIHIYVNGILTVSSGGFSTNIVSTDIFAGNNAALNTPFTGRMDDMYIYDYAISTSQVSSLFNERVDTSIPIVRLEPTLATPDDQVRLIYNAERGNKGLMGLEGGNVHIHTGVITTDPNDYQPWNFVIDPTFANNSIGMMTQVAGTANEYEITLGPSVRDFYGVPNDGTPIYKLIMLFRNEPGNIVGIGTPSEYGAFPGGYVTDGTEFTGGELSGPGHIYMDIINPTPLELDQLALEALYNATDGANWFDNTNWLTGSVDTWYGVTVFNGRVTGLDLYENNLIGFIPSEIGKLTAMEYLTLSLNDFTGTSIPAEINQLTNLIDLELFSTSLTGALPDMSALTNLTLLSLADNDFTGSIPASMGSLTNLTDLYLWGNNLTGSIPVELGNLTNLDWLNLATNNLSGTLPSSLGNLTILSYLSITNNSITGPIPASFANLSSLDVLALGGNDLSGSIPSFIGDNFFLSELYLWGNGFTGSIPSNLGNMTGLTELWLSNNVLTGQIPPELNNLTLLNSLALGGNQLTGTIPDLSNLFSLTEFSVYENRLEGDVPNFFNQFANLAIFSVRDNDFENMVDLSGLLNVTDIRAEGNLFTFEDILPNLGVASNGYTYDPQQNAGAEKFIKVPQGTSYIIDLGFDLGVSGSNYDWYINGSYNQSTSSPSLTVSNIQADQTWHVEITNSTAPDLFLTTNNINLELSNLCMSNALNVDDTRVDRVIFGDLDHTSSVMSDGVCATYSNFTEFSATVGVGEVVDLGFQIGTCGSLFNRGIKMYIDWNEDGSFDETELAGQGGVLTSSDPDEFLFFSEDFYTIPDVALGNYTLRVVAQEVDEMATITGCGTYDYGETEDYTVQVIDKRSDLIVNVDDIFPSSMFNSNTPILNTDLITMTISVTNIGEHTSIDATNGIGIYASDDGIWDTGDVLIDMQSLGPIDPATTSTITDIQISPPDIVGSFYGIVVVNPTDEIPETDTGNNVIVSDLIYVASGDSFAPTISLQSFPSSYEIGSGGITVSANVSDDVGLDYVLFAWARISDVTDDGDLDQYNVIFPEENTTGVFSHTLGDSDFDEVGMQFFFGAGDVAGNVSLSDPFPAKISTEFSEGSITLSDPRPISNSASPQETDYRIFSVPVQNATIGSVLGVTTSDRTKWRVFQYNNGNSELSGSGASLAAGKGYWLIYLSDAGVDLNFGGLAVNASNSNPFVLNLQSGINLIGNPYNFAISWQDVIDHNFNQGIIANQSDISGLFFYRGGFSDLGNTTLRVTEGAFIQSNEPVSLEIPFSAQTLFGARNSRVFRNSIDKETWEVGINLSNDATFYNVASVGMDPDANNGFDRFDRYAMPYLLEYLEFNSRNEQFEERISQEFVATDENHSWEFEAITSYDPSEAVLSWDNTYFGDNDRQLYLYDLADERIINMREQTEYHFFLNEKRNFRILYGSPEFIASALQPDRMTLGHAYPNPFADATRIPFSLSTDSEVYKVRMTIYNSVGELVNVLADEEFTSGFYAMDWDGTNTLGQQVSEGIYIYKLTVTDENGPKDLTGKLIYGK